MTVKPTLYHFADFTEKNYRKLLKLAKKNYAFKFFNSYSKPPYVLWRHDVDCSVHRALSLAKIEKELGVKSTYFFHLHSPYYNLLEEASHNRVKKILALGHEIGLHFELPFYPKMKTKNERPNQIIKCPHKNCPHKKSSIGELFIMNSVIKLYATKLNESKLNHTI